MNDLEFELGARGLALALGFCTGEALEPFENLDSDSFGETEQ